MRAITVIDPGHGGTVDIGRSTPYGVRGPNGLLEKDVTLALARRVAERMGTSLCLTRYGDVNLSLADRARLSRDLESPVFLSIHTNGGARGAHGSEAWVHSNAGPASIALAEDVRGELARIGIADHGVRRGDLAVLRSSQHAAGCAACLIEVEHLDHEDGARRLGNPRQFDAVADALARGLERHLGRPRLGTHRPHSFGWTRGLADAPDLTDFPTNIFVVIPDADASTVPREIRKSDLDKLQNAWHCMMRSKGLTLEGSDDHQRDFRVLLRGGLSDSPMIRDLFQEIACDETHPLTMHVGRKQSRIFVDAFQFDPTQVDPRTGSTAAAVHQAGHHVIDLDDFDQMPRVSGNPRNNMMLMHQNLVHALREARQGLLGDAFPVAHERAIDDENAFRQEQGQRGSLDHFQPVQLGTDMRWDFLDGGAVGFFETWHLSADFESITSIDYSP